MTNNLKEIREFINQWKERAIQFYFEELDNYNEIFKERNEISRELRRLEKINSDLWEQVKSEEDYDKLSKEIEKNNFELNEVEKQYKIANEIARKKAKEIELSSFVKDALCYGKESKNRIIKLVEREAVAKEKMLIARVNNAVGIILEAKALYVGVNGELNGYIKGEDGTCKIETIYAGGYNIQCLHYRVLVKKV